MIPSGIILNSFFLFLDGFRLTAMVPAGDFDFSSAGEVRLTAVTFRRDMKHDYMLFLVPVGSGVKVPFPESRSQAAELTANLAYFGYRVDSVLVKEGGARRITGGEDAYATGKVVLSFDDEGGSAFHIVIPEYFLAAVFRCCGVLADGAVEIEKPQAVMSEELPFIDLSLLYSRNRIFVRYYTLFEHARDDLDLSLTVKALLESGFVDYNHLASLCGFYRGFTSMLESASKNTFDITMRLRSQLEPFILHDSPGALRWKAVLDYQMQNVVSKLVFEGNPDIPRNIFFSERIKAMDSAVFSARLGLREKCFPFAGLMEYFLSRNNAAFLISGVTMSLLTELAGLEYEADYASLYRKFGQEFREDFTGRVRKARSMYGKVSEEKRDSLINEKLMAFRNAAESEVMQNVIGRRPQFGYREIYGRLMELDAVSAVVLYNLTGYEMFVSVFDALKYVKGSPVSVPGTDSLFDTVTSMLPFAERIICRDIYREKINRDRIINDNTHDRAVKSISRALVSMDELNMCGGRND